jgi:hypothetical protein
MLNSEMIDGAMQEGYIRLQNGDTQSAITIWLDAWEKIKAEMTNTHIKTIWEFDEVFEGSEMVYNWLSDLEEALLNECWKTGDHCRDRIRFCEDVIDRTDEDDTLMIENMRRDIADSHVRMGDRQKADDLFGCWLKADPAWGWGWIGWSDSYGLFIKGEKDYGRVEEILKQGLTIPGVRDRKDILGRLLCLYDETGRKDDAGLIREELYLKDDSLQDGERQITTDVSIHGNVISMKTNVHFGETGMPLEEWEHSLRQSPLLPPAAKKMGRNAPCPCGSGKKYKKCCGR